MTQPPSPAPIPPLTAEELKSLEADHELFQNLALRLAEMEVAKPRLIMALTKARDAKAETMAKVLRSRGLPPHTAIDVDSTTGAVTLVTDEPSGG